MGAFTGKLKSNLIFAALFNMIISQYVFADNVKGTYSKLVDEARVDGGMYGDTKLYYSTDALKSYDWLNDEEAQNLLKLYRPKDPECQAITIDVFRQIPLTLDNYLTKQAWATEGAFSSFNSVMMGWIRITKKIYDASTYNTFIGSVVADTQEVKEIGVNPANYPSLGQGLGEVIANLLIDMSKVSRKYNDYKMIRSYDSSDLKFIWNAKYINQVKKIDLPALFHNEGLVDKFAEDVLPEDYFHDTLNTTAKTTADADTRSAIEQDIKLADDTTEHFFAGMEIPVGTTLVSGGKIIAPSYQVNKNIICKVTGKGAVPYMSGFEVATSFFNPKSLTETHYLTYGHNTLESLKDKPIVTIKLTEE